jgi:hypothetical protein
MRTRRSRPPGFAAAAPPPPPTDAAEDGGSASRAPAPAREAVSYRDAPVRQLNIRLAEPLHQRYRRLLRDLDDAGTPSTWTELVHALLHDGPADAETARKLLDRWRAAR